ncbi:MAG: hypothetical protein JNJ46_31875 [Myxococcales bacterium]|nr:hypothetical protein [Myxococcales bacterium]
MSFKSQLFSGVLIWLLPVAGCFLRPQTVIDRFAAEFRCPKDQVKVEQPDKNSKDFFRAIGCNRRANYRCSGDYGEFCERIGQPETITPEAGELSASMPQGESSPSTPPTSSATQPAAPPK